MQQLVNSMDSFELRFSTRIPSKFHYGQILVIKKNAESWTCLEYNYIFRTARYGSSDVEYLRQFAVDTIWIYKKQPKSGWQEFFSQVAKENICGLPDGRAIERSLNSLHVIQCDGIVYDVEFVCNNKYRNYGFNFPQVSAKEIVACRRMTNIIKIFDDEFGVADKSEKIVRRLPEPVINNYDTALRRLIREMKL